MAPSMSTVLQTFAGRGRRLVSVPARLSENHACWTSGQILRAIALAGLVFIFAFGAVALTKVDDRTSSVWLANAIIIAIVIRAPRAQWFALLAIAFCANFGANLANDDPVLRGVLLAAINVIESMIVIMLMGRRFEQSSWFGDGTVIARFLLYAGVVGPLAAATLAAATLHLTDGVSFSATLIGWYVADALGLLTLGALLLAIPTRRVATPRGERLGDVVGITLAGVVSLTAFGQDNALLLFIVAPVLMIATLRASLIGALLALTLCVAIAIGATALGSGPIDHAQLDTKTGLYVLQGFIAAMLFVVLPVRALASERDRLGGVIVRSERLFARIAEASPSGTIHFDPLGQPTYANHRWKLLTGLDHTAPGKDRWLDTVALADRSAASSLWTQAQATLEPCTGKFRFGKEGTPAGHAELNIYPEVEDGTLLGFVARLTDVTDRRLAEDALQEREAQYRLVTENAHDVILRLGLDGRLLYVSGASLRATGFAPVEMVGRSLGAMIHGDDLPLFNRTLSRVAEGITDPSIEFRLRHRDGHFSWFESSQRVLFDRDGRPIELVASLRDIELRRRSEATATLAAAQLRATNRLLLLAEELAGVGHWHFDPTARELDHSPQINRILQRERNDRLRVSTLMTIVHAADRRRLLLCLARTRRSSGTAECAIRLKARDGMRHVQLVAQAEFRGDQFTGWSGVVRDVTDKVVADTALIEARDAGQAAAVAKSNFLATMSHEIRTPMTGVLGMIDLLRDDPSPAERERLFAALKQSADGLLAVLDDVLDVSKIDSGALQLEMNDFDPDAVAMATLDLFGNAASFDSTCASGVPLDVLIAEDNPVNQILIASIVRRMGHAITVVGNGRQAVEAATARYYDVILMDMQMPEMDGLAATRAIRASDGACARTTIIALTADASPERRRFYDGVGLSQFLTKPIDRQALGASLAAIGALRTRSAHSEPVADPLHALVEPRRIAELTSAVGSERLHALLGLLMTQCLDRPARLRTAWDRGELVAIRAEGHNLRGAAFSIGATALGQAAQELEAVGSIALAEPLIEALEDCAQATLAAIRQMLADPNALADPRMASALPSDRAAR